ncbi:MAG: M56 family metallopeptidase [Melioribacteraceae bacterium]
MNFIYDFFPDRLIETIGWTIFHSLWQSIVVAILLGSALLMTRSNNSQLRYKLSSIALFVMFVISLSTFAYLYSSDSVQAAGIYNSASGIFSDSKSVNAVTPANTAQDLDPASVLKNYFEQNISAIVTVWLAGFILFSFRFAGGIFYVRRLKNAGLISPEKFWADRLNILSQKLDLTRLVRLFESCKVKTPVTIGYLKPVILLPLGMLTGLPQDQIEAIIIHELAHIKRYDFLINLFQTFIETIFFYHPVVWWISSAIKSERENCCDDMTLKLCGGSLIYFKALYNLQQMSLDENGLALAVTGKKNQLFRRINRMNSNNKNTSYGIKFASFAALLLLIAAASLYSTSSAKENAREYAPAASVNPFSVYSGDESPVELNTGIAPSDTTSIKKGKRTLKFSDDDKKYRARLNDGRLLDLYVDGKKVDEKELPKYEALVTERLNEFDSSMEDFRREMKDYKGKMKQFREKMKQFRGTHGFNHDNNFEFDIPVPPVPEFPPAVPHMDSTEWKEMMNDIRESVHSSLSRHSIKMPKIRVPHINLDELDIDLEHLDFDKEEFRESMMEWKKNFKKEMEKWNSDNEGFKKDMEKFKEEMKKSGPNSEAFKKSMEELRVNMDNLKVEMKKLKNFVRDAKDELVKDNLMEKGDDLEDFTLSKDEMVIDGKKVSPELHKKYLELYKKSFGKELKGDEKFRIND